MQFSSVYYKAQNEEVKKRDAINRGSSVSIKLLNCVQYGLGTRKLSKKE